MVCKVLEYLSEDSKNHYREWFDGLPAEHAAKVAAARARMMVGNMGNVKPLDGALKEYRIDWGPGIRIYLLQDGEKLVVLLGGGTKKGQNADIKKAKLLRDEYFSRKSASKKQ